MIFVLSLSGLEHEQDHEGDDEREQRHGFREREAQEHVAEHARGSFRVAQRARDEAAEDVADADAHARESDGGEAGADELGCRSVHGSVLSSVESWLKLESGAVSDSCGW